MASKKLCVAAADMRNSELNEDVWVEILGRLPNKQLFRLMCVSTSWRRIISAIVYPRRRKALRPISGFFIQWNHHLGVLNNFRLLRNEVFGYVKLKCRPRRGDSDDDDDDDDRIQVSDTTALTLSFLPSYLNLKILDCRDGLVLCSPKENGRDGEIYYLCNPLTRKWIRLPKAPVPVSCVTAAVAFESPVSLHYKVFRFFGPSGRRDSRRIYAEVFSSRTGEWAVREMALDLPFRSLCDQRAVFLDGALYLQAYKHAAVRVEVMEERCLVVELPMYKGAGAKGSIQERMGVCQGRLHYACRDGPWLRIWMLGGSGGWVLKHGVRIHDLQHALVGNVTVLGFHPDKDIIYVRTRCGVGSIQFNEDGTKSYCFGLYHIPSKEHADTLWFWVYPFSESLHPVAVVP